MNRMVAVAVCVSLTCTAVKAQERPRIEIGPEVGASNVFRANDQSFGTALSAGARGEWRLSPRVGISVDVSRVSGLSPGTLPCAAPSGVTCIGTARDGVLAATVGAVTVAAYLGRHPRIQPYLLAGVSLVRARLVSSLTTVNQAEWTVTEVEERDTGAGLTAGGGLRLAIGPRLAIRPEWRLADGSIRGRANLGVMRTSVSATYGW